MPRIITLPDTRRVQIPDGIDDAQAFAVAKQYFPNSFPAPEVEVQEPVKPPEQGGIFSDLFSAGAKGAKQMASQSRTGIASLFGNAEEQALSGIERSKALEEQYKDVRGTNIEKIKEPFKRGEYGTAALEAVSQSPYAIAENLPQIAGMGIGTVLGGALGTLVGPAGTAAGAIAGRALGATVGAGIAEFLVSAVQQRGSNVERQAQEQIQRGEPVNIDSWKASAAAAGQGVADVISYRLLGGANLVGKILGKTEDQFLKLSAKKAEDLLQESFTKTAAKGLGTGFLAEIPAEIGQTMLERWQAGLELTSPDALSEYGDTAIGVGLLAPLGAAGRFSEKSTAKGFIKQQEKLTQFDRNFTGLIDQNMGSGNFSSNSDSLYDARERSLSQAAVGTNMTVYDSVGRDAEAIITGRTEDGIPIIKVDASGTDRAFVLGQEYDIISPVNKDIRLSDNTPVSQLSGEDVQNRMAILKPLVDSNRIELANGNDLVQHHVMERDLAALVAQDAFNATIPVSAKAAINKGNKERRDRVKNNANGVPVVDTGAITPLTTATEVTTEPLAASAGQAAATPLPVVDQAAEDPEQAAIDAAIEADAFKRLQEETPPSAETLQRNRVLAAVQQSVDNDFLESIRETIGDLELQPDTKKSQVTAYAKKLLKQGIITEAELEPILRISKDRDMGVEDITSELSLSVENYFSNKLPKYSKTGKAAPAYKVNTGAQKLIATIKEERQKKQYEAALPRVALLIAKRMKQLGLNINVEKLMSIVEVGADGKPSMEGKINGQYFQRVITLAIAGKSDAQIMSTLNHEAIHALRKLDMITESEWVNLTKVVENKGWINFFQIPTRYTSQNLDGKTEDEILTILSKEDYFQETVNGKSVPQTKVEIKEQLVEEAIADAFSTYATGRSPIIGYLDAEQTKPTYIYKAQLKLGGQPVGIITRLIKMLRGIREVVSGEEVFKRIQEAPMASPVAVAPAAVAVTPAAATENNIKVVNSGINLTEQKDDSRDKKAKLSATTRQSEQTGDRGGRGGISRFTPLPMAPSVQSVYGPDRRIVEVAERYAEENGIDLKRQSEYVQVDPVRGKLLSDAYEEMAHDPQDPVVKKAYKNLIEQTTAQYRALEDAGYRFWFIDTDIPDNLNYLKSPWNAIRDIRANKEMGVFPTTSGYGTEEFDTSNNPMLASTGIEWPNGGIDGSLKPVLANDLFRAVHDAFGHGLEGAGFRADGEENAWQGHIRMYTGSAKGAITSETRGQNSVVNYGPNAEFNRTANAADTIYADQKTGLMPEWTWSEGISKDEPTFQELNAKQDAEMFRKAVDRVKRGRSMAFPLHVHDVNTYRNARLFLSKDKESGFALIGDEIGSFFSGGGGQAYPTLRLAVAEGGKRIDAYRSVMPKVLGKAGFRPVARVKFDPKQATDIWNYKKFAQFQGGKPDLVFFVHDAGFKGDINEETAKAPLVDYSKAVAIQTSALPVRYSKTPEFKRFTHGNQIINLNEKHKFVDGVPVVVQVVHGTTGDYEFFDRSKLNQESDLGAGFYFTNSLADVNANYAGMGPDLTNKVDRTAERIASETDREYNDPDVIEEARNQFLANEGQVMPVYVRFDNPVVLGGKKETFLDFNQNYNEKTEEYGEPTGKFVDFVEALKDIAGNERYGNVNVDKVVSDLYEKVTDNDGISANDLIKTAKKSDGLVYAEDYEKDGELASTEIIRLAFEEIGYDGFIDQTVVNKFSRRENIKGKVVQKPMAGVTEDTVHFIAFKQNQVKSSVGNLGSYGERSLTKGELEQEGITAEEAKARQKLGYIRYSATAKPTDTPAFKRLRDDKENKVTMWYNRAERSWVVQSLDWEGNQIGDATYVYTRQEAEQERKLREAAGGATLKPDIRYSRTSPVWYSELSRQIDKLPQKEMTAAEWKALLVNPAETKSRGVRGADNKVIPGKFTTTEIPATSKLPGVKMKEIDDTEILEWFDVQAGNQQIPLVGEELYSARRKFLVEELSDSGIQQDYTSLMWGEELTPEQLKSKSKNEMVDALAKEDDVWSKKIGLFAKFDDSKTTFTKTKVGDSGTKISTAEVQQFLADGGSKIEFQDVMLGTLNFLSDVEAQQYRKYQEMEPDEFTDADLDHYTELEKRVKIENRTKFDAYQLPGGTNYREAFVTVPNATGLSKKFAVFNDFDGEYYVGDRDTGNPISRIFATQIEAENSLEGFNRAGNASTKWVDGHGAYSGINNPVVRIRFNDRVDAEGKKVLFLEELQPPNNPEFGKMPKSLQDRWLAIGLKRMIRHAAEEGYDKIAWTTGEQQVERYRDALRQKIDSIEWEKTPEGVHIKGYKVTGGVTRDRDMSEDIIDNVDLALVNNDMLGFDRLGQARAALLDDGAGTAWMNRWDVRGSSAEDIAAMQAYIDASFKKTKSLVADTTYKETDLTQAIGKLMADRIRNDPSQTGTIEGEDLSIDSVGVKKLYDVGVPALANKILKEMGGGKVGEVKIEIGKSLKDENFGDADTIIQEARGEMGEWGYKTSDGVFFETYADAVNHEKLLGNTDKAMQLQPAFDITTPLREKAMSGVPRYSKVAKTEEQKAVDKGNLRVKGAAIREEKLGSAAIVSARPGNVVATVSGITPDKIKNLHRRAAAIINTKAAKAFFATLGATKVEAITIGGLWKGVAEPSFFLTAKDANGDNLSYDKMRGIANILASAFQQDAAITSEGLNKPKPTDKVNTTLFLGKADGSVLNEREISGVFKELSNLKIDGASITTDNKAFKILWFPNDKINDEQNEQNLEAFSTSLRDAVRAYGIDGYYLGYTRSNLDDLLEKKDGVYRSRSKESLREAWDTDVAGRSSLLFGGATDHFLVPYILSVKAEGGQFDFNRWQFLNQATDAERTGLEQKVLAYDAIVNEVGLSPEEAASVNLLIGRTGLGNKDTFAIGKVGGLPAIVRHLDEQRNASGLRKLDVNNEDDRETLSKLMAAEAVAAVRGSGNAIDWYDAEIKKTLDIMAVKYPELTTDPVARLAFRIAMAITSQTLNVEANFRFAMKQYEGYRKSKGLRKFPIDGEGKSIIPMKANFTKANYLLAALGPTTFPRFLVTDFTVKELSSMGIKINGENMDTDLLGSVVFGPKIGYGFLSNLMGNFEPTTFDMWFMRMVGRLTGNLPQFKQSLFDNQLANFIRSFEDVGTDGVYADKFDPKLLRDVANSTDNAEILKLAKKVVTAHEADYKEYREQYDPKFGIPTRRRTPFVSAAFGIVKSLEKPKDSPASGTERNNLRDVMKKLVAKMTTLNGGVRIPPAALQALVWYPEQFLYESMGAKLRVTGQSYSGAATKIIKETKITSQQKEDVEKIASRKTVPGVAVEKAAVPFTQAEKSAFLNKYKNQFNITVKESDDADVIQDIEDETPGNKVRVTTKPFSIARFVGDSSKEKRSVVPDTNFYRENSYMMSLADYMGKPIHLYVGTEKNTLYQKPYGLMHILDNAAKSTARRFENLTDNDSENAVRGVMNILGARDVVAYSETAGKVLLRSESNKAYVVLGDSMSGWSVISVVPSMDARKFGNAIINRGQKVTLEEKFFPARLFANAPLVRSIEFVPYSKAPSVEIKKRRVVEIPKMSVARYSGATIPKYPTTLLGGASIPKAWQSPASDKLTNLQYIFTDKFIDLKNVMKAITSTMGQVSDQFNAYLREELFHGRVAKQVFDFAKDELRPLLASMQSLNVTIPEIELYLQNRTAESYNNKIAAIGGMADGGSGILTADARAYLASIPPAKLYAYTSLAKRVDAMTKQTRELMVAGGLEDRATINAWETANPQYVPLQRDLGRDEGVSGMGQGFSVTHKVARAMGSAKSVKDILANIVATRERTIVKSEKNKIGQAVLGLALKAPNPDYWLAIDPNGNKNKAANFTALLNMGLSINEATMIAQEPKVRYTDSVTGMIAERVNPMIRNMPNVLHVMVNGKERLVIFNPDEKHPSNRLVRTLKNLDIGELGPIMGWVAKVTRWIAAINTQYNPIFGVINFLRDYQTGLLNLTSTPLAGMQGQIAGDTFPAMMGIFAQMRSYKTGVPATGRWAKLFEDFEKAGGPTGYREMFATSEDRADALASEFKQLTEGRAKKIGRGVIDALSTYNTAMENAVRLAAFDAGLKKGLREDKAASIAKNLTVNFNRKGDIAMQAGALYAFFNASAQGSARIAQTLSGPAGRKILGGALTLGVMQAIALAAAGFGDNEPPEFIKDKNLVIPTGDGKYITIPMPLGFNIIPSFSRMMTEVTFYGKGNQAKKIVSWMNGAFGSLNPLGGGVAAQTIFPSAVDPIIALLQNKDAFGRRIYKEDISGLTPTAGYLRTKETATPWAKGLAEFMNMATGGTQFKQGIISPTPDQIDYLIGQATGGIGRESAKIAQTISSSATGEELPSYKIPLVSRFFGDTKEGASEANKFYDNLIRVNEHGVELKGYRERRGSGNAALYIKENPEARLVPMARHTQEVLSNLNKQKRLALERDLPRERIKQIEELAKLQMRRFNERVEAMR